MNLWTTTGSRYPGSSLAAHVAARAAGRQGPEAGERYHWALFRAFFVANRDISDRNVLSEVAKEVGLDRARFDADAVHPRLKEELLAAHVTAVEAFGVAAVPTVIIGVRRFEGAVAEAEYRGAILQARI